MSKEKSALPKDMPAEKKRAAIEYLSVSYPPVIIVHMNTYSYDVIPETWLTC